MTHGDGDDGDHTRIDGRKVADLPGGIHLDSHEVKWILAAALAGVLTITSGRQEIAYAVGAGALGLRAAPGPLTRYTRQPWWALFGLGVGLVIGLLVEVAMRV